MNLLIHSVLTYILLYGTLGIFFMSMIAAIGFPLPGTAIVLAAGAFAAQGYFHFPDILLAAFLGNCGGNITAYILSRRYGLAFLQRLGFDQASLLSALHIMDGTVMRHAWLTLFVTRFFGVISSLANVAAGLFNMPFLPFIIIGSLGEAAEVSVYAMIGYVFGSNWEYVHSILGAFSGMITSAIFLFFGYRILRHILHRGEII